MYKGDILDVSALLKLKALQFVWSNPKTIGVWFDEDLGIKNITKP